MPAWRRPSVGVGVFVGVVVVAHHVLVFADGEGALCGEAYAGHHGHHGGGAHEGHQAPLPRVALQADHGFFYLFQHAAVEVAAQSGLLLVGLVAEQVAVGRQGGGHVVLAEEFAQDALLGHGGFALPIALQELFYVFIVHSFLFFQMLA